MQQQIADDKLLQLQAGLARIKQRFIEGLPERVAEFDQLMDALYETENTVEVVEAIGQRAHKLHGQAGSFGFNNIGALAAKLEHTVDEVMNGPRPVQTEGVETALVDLLDLIDAELSAG